MKLILYSIPLIIGMSIVGVKSLWREFEFIRIENAKNGSLITDFKVRRYNRTTVTLNGILHIAADLIDYDCEWKFFFSSKGDSHYVLSPLRVPRQTCCQLLETVYWKAVENRLLESSDVPERITKENYCVTLKKNVYTLRNFAFDPKIIPKYMDTGTYRAQILLYKKSTDEITSLSTYTARLY